MAALHVQDRLVHAGLDRGQDAPFPCRDPQEARGVASSLHKQHNRQADRVTRLLPNARPKRGHRDAFRAAARELEQRRAQLARRCQPRPLRASGRAGNAVRQSESFLIPDRPLPPGHDPGGSCGRNAAWLPMAGSVALGHRTAHDLVEGCGRVGRSARPSRAIKPASERQRNPHRPNSQSERTSARRGLRAGWSRQSRPPRRSRQSRQGRDLPAKSMRGPPPDFPAP